VNGRGGRLLGTLGWLIAVAAIAFGAAGLTVAMQPSPDRPARPELTSTGDRVVRQHLEAAERSVDALSADIDALGTQARGALAAMVGGETDTMDAAIADLTRAALLLSPYAERRVLKKIAVDLLTTYVGRRSAGKVYEGAIDRGKAENITATILIADLRGFTRYSDTHQIDNVLSTLNDFFDALVEAIEPHGGEVLKFIGDALLAIFPAGDKQALPCAPAIAAALDARKKIAALNEERAKAERSLLKFGLALNVGEIAYGNIGSKTRLDFTAIGPAINHTSRLLEVAKKRNRDIVVSESFVKAAGSEFPTLGHHALRDVAGEQQVFYVADDD